MVIQDGSVKIKMGRIWEATAWQFT